MNEANIKKDKPKADPVVVVGGASQEAAATPQTEAKPEQVKTNVEADNNKPEFKVDQNTVFLILYVMLKMHIITSMQLKRALQIISSDVPAELPTWLVKEAGKA